MERYYRNFLKFISLIFISLFFLSCGSSTNTSSMLNDSEDVVALKKEIDDSPFFADALTEEVDGVSEDQGDVLSRPFPGTEGTILPPVAWGRKIDELISRDVDIHIEDRVANVTVTSNVAGTLYVDNTHNRIRDPWEKPFYDTATRHAVFHKRLNGWRLAAISPVEVALTDREKQTVEIKRIRVSTGDEIIWEAESPDMMFDVPEEIPVLTADTLVKVEAWVSNSKTEFEPASFVYLHRPGGRDRMNDNGLFGDSVAGDGVYTRIYMIGHDLGKHFATVDVIDSETFLNEDTDYNSTAWGMPYFVAHEFAGVMEYVDVEGGCWRLVTEDGGVYMPIGADPELYQDGKEVVVIGIPRSLVVTTCMVGKVLEVLKVLE